MIIRVFTEEIEKLYLKFPQAFFLLYSFMGGGRVGWSIFLHLKVLHNAERNTKFINLEEIIYQRNVILWGRFLVQVVGVLISGLHIQKLIILVCRI